MKTEVRVYEVAQNKFLSMFHSGKKINFFFLVSLSSSR